MRECVSEGVCARECEKVSARLWLFVYVCVCVQVSAHVCVYVCVNLSVHVCVCVCVRVCKTEREKARVHAKQRDGKTEKGEVCG